MDIIISDHKLAFKTFLRDIFHHVSIFQGDSIQKSAAQPLLAELP